ncbi:MAG: hypothetical protein RQ736_00500 [Thiogranum sp.]|nr:hypothetical protein [Thiogranum sp.]
MNKNEAELLEQIEQIINRLQEVQCDIAGDCQSSATLELDTLLELRSRYTELYDELREWYAARAAARKTSTDAAG